ncbi:pectinesterase/pectinesterase inhibitor PPE8B-like [Ananas comosus]|uniref:Pectinesterase n=1 Tax=Ananas comosus TaxID=4615 RepID=A0A6P5GKQ1_ANACO|nr:pectinesterase/pectinesterase inhibitor PPE8B-like [Ananas comosus]
MRRDQDTCTEGFDGTDSILGSLVSGGLQLITSLVGEGLSEIAAAASGGGGGGGNGRKLVEGFPNWVTPGARRRILQSASSAFAPDAVVAQDGSGNYTTVTAAVEAAPLESEKRYVIYVKKGVYRENVDVKKKKWNLMLVGDGMGQTVITGSRNFIDGWTTFRSATVAVSGKGFIARDLTIENTAGPTKHQAVALRSDSDLSAFYRCSFEGYQDTLYAHSLRQFYRDCRISGTVDFIFGNAAAVFQNCQIFVRRPLPDQKNSVTAHGRKDPNQNTGFALQFCNVSADSDLSATFLANATTNQTYTYLGRPWKEYSRTVIMQSYIGNVIRPEGWLEWNGTFGLDTLFYGEYMNFGPGSGLGGRVKWPGYHAMNSSAQAVNFTVAQFIDGNLWLPSTGVKYTAGLMV